MWSELLVFVSSTSDLAREREAIARGLPQGFKAYLYEHDRSGSYPPEERIRKTLAGCEVAAFVLGSRYGSSYPDSRPPMSIVEWEFETAGRLGKTEILTYLKRVDEKQTEEKQRHFREGVVEAAKTHSSVLADSCGGFCGERVQLSLVGDSWRDKSGPEFESVAKTLNEQNRELAERQQKLSRDISNLENDQQSRIAVLEAEFSRQERQTSQALQELRDPWVRNSQWLSRIDPTESEAVQEEILSQQEVILGQLQVHRGLIESIQNSQVSSSVLEEVNNIAEKSESNDRALGDLKEAVKQIQGQVSELNSMLEALRLPPARSFLLTDGSDLEIPEYGLRVRLKSERNGQLRGFQILDLQSGHLIFPAQSPPPVVLLGQEIRFQRDGVDFSLTPGFKVSRLLRHDLIGIEVRRMPGSAAAGN